MKKLMLILVMMAAAAPLYAAQGELATFGIALGAGLAISLAALGGGIGQGIACAEPWKESHATRMLRTRSSRR